MVKCVFLMESIIRLIIVLIITRSASLKANGAVTKDPPEMWLTIHTRDEAPVTIHLEHKTDFEIEHEANRVFVTCEADYPITLKFPHPRNAEEFSKKAKISNYRISDWEDDAIMPENIKFKLVTEVYLYSYLKLFNFNITCVPVDTNIKISQPSIHIFWKGMHSIEHQGETLKISTTLNNNPPLVLPCRPANPNMTVVLEKKTANTNQKQHVWTKINSSENHFAFDPKFGYTLQNNSVDQQVFGLYRCSIKENTTSIRKYNKTPFIVLNVTKSTSSSYEHDHKFVPKTILNGNASIVYLPYDKNFDAVKCCSGIMNKPPKMYVVNNYNPLQAQVSRNSILKDFATGKKHPVSSVLERLNDCYKAYPTLQPFSMLVVCQGQNIDFAEEFTYAFRPAKTSNRSHVAKTSDNLMNKWLVDNAGKHGGPQDRITPATQLVATTDIKLAPISQKIMLTVLGRVVNDKRSRLATFQYLCDKHGNSNTRHSAVHLDEYDRDFYYNGEKMVFMCLGGKMLYANGGYLKLTWKNGTKTILNPTPKDYIAMSCLYSVSGTGGYVHLNGNGRLGYSDFTAEVKFGTALADPEMGSVECLLPQWDSTKWDTISKNLTILPNVAPKFAEMDKEGVNFTVGEKWKALICTVKQGIPLPTVAIFNDGLPFKTDITYDKKFENELLPGNDIVFTSYRDNENELTVVITFPIVQRKHQGIYQCEAKNTHKTVTRTMRVSVIEQPRTRNKDI